MFTGDFNLPNIDWETLNISSELGVNGTLSAKALLDLMSGNFLSQVVDKPTRVNNILDLVLTNRSQYIADIESTKHGSLITTSSVFNWHLMLEVTPRRGINLSL